VLVAALVGALIPGRPIETQAAGGASSAWAWGSNAQGQLGDGSLTSSSTPVGVVLPAGTTLSAIAAGGYHNLALTSGGNVLAWGRNDYGQLGNGTATSNRSTPVQVNLPPGTTATAIAAGEYHSLALTSTGQVLAWGYNGNGELGNATTIDSSLPLAVIMPLPAGLVVTKIAAGLGDSLALTSTGQVLAWGDNASGQLGNASTSSSSTPVQVAVAGGTTVTDIAGGAYHSLARTSAGQVLAWGLNYEGQLGNGTTTDSHTPVEVSLPAGTTVTGIAGGGDHSLALTSTGQVLTWGYNPNGQLGNGTTTTTGCSCNSTPAAASLPAGTTATAIAGGWHHSLALASTGQVLSWGYNVAGQLGNGTTTTTGCYCVSTPAAVSALSATVIAITAGGHHSLVMS